MLGDLFKLLVSLAGPFLVGILSGRATATSVRDWYPTLRKPWWTPPGWLFPLAWSVFYFMMGIAVYLVWRGGLDQPGAVLAVTLFVVQLVINALWSPVFFGLRNMRAGFWVVLLLDAAVVATILAFWPVNRLAALLLVPYLFWGLFATALNFRVWRMNVD